MLRNLSRLDVTGLSERFGDMDPRTLLLGCSVATWPYVPYRVLRKCRRFIDQRMPTFLEAVLCESPLVDGCATDGFSLESSFRLAALSLLRCYVENAGPEPRDELLALQRLLSANYSQISPLLAVEADLAWDYVLLNGNAFQRKVEERLRDVLYTAVLERRDGVLDWIAGASGRLPSECVGGEAAWLLQQLCTAQGVEMAPVAAPAAVTPSGLMALVSDRLPQIVVGVHRRSGLIEFGPPSLERSVGIVLLSTDPMFALMRERHPTTGLGPLRSVPVYRGQVTRVSCGDGEIVIGNLGGQTFTLAALQEGRCPEAVVADKVVGKAKDARARRLRLRATVIRAVEAGYVVSLDEIGATAYLASPERELCPGDDLTVMVDRVFEDRRWISAVPTEYPEELCEADRNAVLRVPEELMPWVVEPGDVFPAKVVKHGEVRHRHRRSAHVYVDPRSLLGRITLDTRPGHLRFGAAVRQRGAEWDPPVGASMEIVVSGKVGKKWELRLRPCSAASQPETRMDPLKRGRRVTATVTSVTHKGARLEGPNGEELLLPRMAVLPLAPEGAPIALRPGDKTMVRILRGSEKFPGRFIVSQRALEEPHLDRIAIGSVVVGRIFQRVADGRLLVALDPMRGVSDRPFGALTAENMPAEFRVNMRVSARAASLDHEHWVLMVSDLRPI